MTAHEYTDETKRLIEAIVSGDCCPTCGAPNSGRHFDECPQHPENVQPDLIARARDMLADITDARCGNCGHELFGPDAYRQIVPELVAELERFHSWDGLMSLVDEHYPADIFPTEEDSDTRDPGPRIISLLRVCNDLRLARRLTPVVDDLASERLDGLREDCEELRRAVLKAEDARDAALFASDQANDALAELRRQLPDDDAEVRRVQ